MMYELYIPCGPAEGPAGPDVDQSSTSVDRLEVVLRHVVLDLAPEVLRLDVGGPVVQAGPDPRVDDLLERVGEPIELAELAREGQGRRLVGDLVHAEEVLQDVQVRAVEAEVPGRMVRVWRRDQRCPRRVGLGLRVAVLVAARDG